MGEMVNIGAQTSVTGGSPRLTAYLTRPPGTEALPGVVMVHEAWGLDAVMKRSADHLAAMGYVVIAPDLYTSGFKLGCLRATFSALRAGRGPAFQDIEACRQWLVVREDTAGGTGVIGFCMGGAFALLLAAPGAGYDVSSANYGFLPSEPDEALRDSCPVVASYGGKDKQLAKVPAKLEEIYTRDGTPHDVKVYPTAGHAFLNDAENSPWLLRPMLRVAGAGPEPVAAEDAWRRIGEFFSVHLAR